MVSLPIGVDDHFLNWRWIARRWRNLNMNLHIDDPIEMVIGAISKILGKQEAEKMVMSILEEFLLEGEKKNKIQYILKTLNKRFKKVPKSISQSVNSYTDLIALDSLFELALDCETLADFERELVH
jgi:hypothetical protein